MVLRSRCFHFSPLPQCLPCPFVLDWMFPKTTLMRILYWVSPTHAPPDAGDLAVIQHMYMSAYMGAQPCQCML